MGVQYPLPGVTFNRSVDIEARPERLSSDGGALLLREMGDKLGLFDWLASNLHDPRDPGLVTHPFEELLRTSLLLAAQGWGDQDDADGLRDDPVFRLAVSSRKGQAPLRELEGEPCGLPSQPTLSRFVASLATPGNRAGLARALALLAGRRLQAQGGPPAEGLVIDFDSMALETHGHQPQSEYHGHYHMRCYHPLIATLGELGDIVGATLRHGKAHTAEGADEYILDTVAQVERDVGEVFCVRMDAGFPSEHLLATLEGRDEPIHYVARIRRNQVLDRLAGPLMLLPWLEHPDEETTIWYGERIYKARNWSRPRRIVAVKVQEQGELFANSFYLVTSLPQDEVPAAELLALYRRRGRAENYMGEWKSGLHPLLSSNNRTKRHYRGQEPAKRAEPVDAFANNEVTLLLSMLAYQLTHALRTLQEEATGRTHSLVQFRERVMKVAARVLLSARRITVVVPAAASRFWQPLLASLEHLPAIT
jgi:hypothetical protein